MNNLPVSIAAIAVGLIVGVIVFQSFVVAPAVFGNLDEQAARRFLRSLFPRFFRLNAAAALVATGSLVAAGVIADWTLFYSWTTVAAALIAICMVVSLLLVPAINTARDQGDAGAARFARLHRVTVLLTVASLLLGAVILSAIGATSAGY